MKMIPVFLLYFLSILSCSGQNSDEIIVQTSNCNDIIAGINNFVTILKLDGSIILDENLSVYLYTSDRYLHKKSPKALAIKKENGRYKIRPDSVGWLEIRLDVNGDIQTKNVAVKPLKAVCRLGSFRANTKEKIPLENLKSQSALIAYIECCGFEAKCKITSFEIIRIGKDELSSRAFNKGGKFEREGLNLINQAQSNDIYIFRNIYYQCPSTEIQRSEDMIFEIE